MSQDPTMFWILKSVNLALNPSFWMMRAYLREASLLSSSDFWWSAVSHHGHGRALSRERATAATNVQRQSPPSCLRRR